MAYIVTARKWRPKIFEDVIGQSHITTTLRNAIATNRLPHAFIFSGQRGVGKTTTARILAKAINCLNPKEYNPDNTCELCIEITENRSVNVFEIDGASNRGIEEIRNLREAVRYAPAKGKYKVYIIDEVHMLTKEAFNALLKTLEEPPPHVIFIFATTEVHKVPLTILSRCQRFEFRRIPIEEIVSQLTLIAKEENIKIDGEALHIIAKKADGSMRDAQSIFDQVVSFCGEVITAKQIVELLNLVDEELFFKATDIIKSKSTKDGLLLVEEIVNRGYDIREFLNGLIEHLRNVLIVKTTSSTKLIETSENYKQRYMESSNIFSEIDILRLIKIANDTVTSLRWAQQPRLRLEICLLQMIKMESSIEIQSLLEQIEELKNKINESKITHSDFEVQKRSASNSEASAGNTIEISRQSPSKTQAKLSADPPSFYQVSSTNSLAPLEYTGIKERQTIIPTIDDTTYKWSLLISEAQKERVAIGSILSETTIDGLKDNNLQICCYNDFHLDTLKSNREYLAELAKKYFGEKVRLETVKSVSTSQPTSTEKHFNARYKLLNHPIVQAIIKKFDAEVVE